MLADVLGIGFAAGTLAVCLSLMRAVLHGPLTYWLGNWYARGSMVLGIALIAEPISVGIATLAAFLTLLALVFAWRSIDSGANHMQPLLLIFLGAMCGFHLRPTCSIYSSFSS